MPEADVEGGIAPMVSIVVPVYNAERYLGECIDSVVGQSYEDWELILVDDGSTDGSLAICREAAGHDRRIRVFSQANAGVSSARNVALSHAQGRYVLFLDSDDRLGRECCRKASERMVKADVVFWGFTSVYPHGTREDMVSEDFSCEGREAVERQLLRLKSEGVFGFTWNKMLRMDVVREKGLRFVEGLSMFEDEVFADGYCRYADSMSVISEPLYEYRYMSGGNLTSARRGLWQCRRLAECFAEVSGWYVGAELKAYEQLREVEALLMAVDASESLKEKYRLYAEACEVSRDCDMGRGGARVSLLRLWRPLGFVLVVLSERYYAWRRDKFMESARNK